MTSSLLVRQMERFVRCPRCAGVYEEPRLLPDCVHSVCRQCAAALATEDNICCPVCHTDAGLPGGVTQLQLNDVVAGLLDDFRLLREEEAAACSLCLKQSVHSDAKFRCLDCREAHCDACLKTHNLVGSTADHLVVPIEALRLGKHRDDLAERRQEMMPCSRNHGKKGRKKMAAAFFCDDCRQLICRDCNAIDHKDHETNYFEKCRRDLEASLKSQADQLRQKAEQLGSDVEEIATSREQGRQQREQKMHEIDQRARVLHDIIEQWKAKEEQRLLATFDDFNAELDDARRGQEVKQRTLSDLVDFFELLRQIGNDAEFLFYVKPLEKSLGQMLQVPVDRPPVEEPRFNIKPVQGIQEVNLETSTYVALINEQGSVQVPAPLRRSAPLDKGPILALAAFADPSLGIVVSTQLGVFRLTCEGQLQHQLHIDEQSVESLGTRGSAVFLNVPEARQIVVIDVATDTRSSIDTTGIDDPVGVAVTETSIFLASASRNQLLAREDDQGEWRSVLRNFRHYLKGPNAVAALPDASKVVVSNEQSGSVQAFRPQRRSFLFAVGSHVLAGPRAVAFDSRGDVFVAERGNRRVTAVGDDGHCVGTLVEDVDATCLAVVDAENMLLVGDAAGSVHFMELSFA